MNTFLGPCQGLTKRHSKKGTQGLSFTVFPVTPQVELQALYYILRARRFEVSLI